MIGERTMLRLRGVGGNGRMEEETGGERVWEG